MHDMIGFWPGYYHLSQLLQTKIKSKFKRENKKKVKKKERKRKLEKTRQNK